MLLGLDASIWRLILVVLILPVIVMTALNLIFRKRGGVGQSWGGALVVTLAGIIGVLVILEKLEL